MGASSPASLLCWVTVVTGVIDVDGFSLPADGRDGGGGGGDRRGRRWLPVPHSTVEPIAVL